MAILVRLAIVALVAAAFISEGVNAKSMRRAKKNSDEEKQLMCAMKMMSCMVPLMQFAGTSEEQMREDVVEKGLTEVCTPLSSFADCFTEVIEECDVPLTDEQSEAFDMMIKVTNFICKENLQAINADRQCLFGETLDQATNTQCGNPDIDQLAVCQISTHINCASDVYENVCSNPTLAQKFKTFARDLESDAGCYRTLKLRSIVKDFMARM